MKRPKSKSRAGAGDAAGETPNVVKVAQEIAALNSRQGEIQTQLSDLGVKTAKLNGEFSKIQLKRAELRRQFDAASAPS